MHHRFLFCPLASHGYVYPMIGIAQVLRERGHDVAFATDSSFLPTLRNVGINRIPYGEKDGPSFQVELWWHPVAVALQVKHIEHALASFAADVLVGHQLTRGPLIAGEHHGIPIALLGFATYLWPSRLLLERPPYTESERRLIWRYDDMLKSYNEARRLLNLQPISGNYMQTAMLGDLLLVQSILELEVDIDSLPARVHLVGACLWEPPQPDRELTSWLDEAVNSGEQVIYVQHGKYFDVPSFWSHLVEYFKNKPFRVVAASGQMNCEIGQLPPTFFVRDHVLQGAVLPRASAVISTANTVSVLGALTHGLPSLLIPAGGEQLDLAERCQRAGTAIALSPYDINNMNLGQAIMEVTTNQELRASAQAMQHSFARANGFDRAAKLLELLALTRNPVLR